MEQAISINEESCIGCGRCITICPFAILIKSEDKHPKVDKIERCIECGHCVAVCPTSAVYHSTFPDDKVHDINSSALPTSEQVLELIRSRRSNRAFSDKPISADKIEQILEAAHRAPTATNLQKVHFTVITSPDKLREISQFTITTFISLVKKLENPLLKPILKRVMSGAYRYVPIFEKMEREFAKGNDYVLRGASAMILFHTPSEVMFGKEDANLAYQNASLMAESLGIAQFYTGFVCVASSKTQHKKLAEILGVKGSVVHAGMALGRPKFKFKKYIDKKDIVVNYL